MRIAFTGNLCSGKSYLAKILMKKYNLELYSFAGKIKEIATDLFQMAQKDRLLLQNIADKMKEIDPDIWIKYLLNDIGDKDNIIIDDLRFENEVNYLKEHGFTIIRLNVPDDIQMERIKNTYPTTYEEHIKGMSHNSESEIKNLNVDLDLHYLANDYNLAIMSTIDSFFRERCLISK
jgi:dephospho-CoA kinase